MISSATRGCMRLVDLLKRSQSAILLCKSNKSTSRSIHATPTCSLAATPKRKGRRKSHHKEHRHNHKHKQKQHSSHHDKKRRKSTRAATRRKSRQGNSETDRSNLTQRIQAQQQIAQKEFSKSINKAGSSDKTYLCLASEWTHPSSVTSEHSSVQTIWATLTKK